jgi:H+-transporting ATPase
VANAVIGFWEEWQASNAIAALKAKLAVRAQVKRDGKWIIMVAHDLVQGDVIRLRLGDIVPADVRLLDGQEIEIDQSALTGESLPVTVKSGDALYSSSISYVAARFRRWFMAPDPVLTLAKLPN